MIPLGIHAAAHSTYFNEVKADGPLVYIRLDEASGAPTNDGSLTVPISAATAYPTPQAASLWDGVYSADFPKSASVGVGLGGIDPILVDGGATFEAIINFDSLSAIGVILSKSDTAGTGGRLQVSTDGLLKYLAGPVWSVTIASSIALAAGTRYHVAVVLSGTTGQLYINGVAAGAGSVSTLASSAGTWTIGRTLATGYEYPFDGRIAGVAFYNKMLSASRIFAHARAARLA